MREALVILLTQDGHEVHLANDGPSGLKAALTFGPDIGLLDVGHALARSIRAHDEGKSPYAAAVRGHAVKDRGVTVAGGIRRVQRRGANLDDGAGLAGKVSADALGKRVLAGRCEFAGGESGLIRRRCEERGPKPVETLAASGRPSYTGSWKRRVKTEIPA